MPKNKFNLNISVVLLLRIGVFGTFLGHGIYAVLVKPHWIHLITFMGFSNEFAMRLMPVIGIIDILVALIILLYPIKGIILWAAFWAFLTALSRPLAGESFLEFIERSANWVAPLVLYILVRKKEGNNHESSANNTQ